jgi:hypothetical protein
LPKSPNHLKGLAVLLKVSNIFLSFFMSSVMQIPTAAAAAKFYFHFLGYNYKTYWE